MNTPTKETLVYEVTWCAGWWRGWKATGSLLLAQWFGPAQDAFAGAAPCWQHNEVSHV